MSVHPPGKLAACNSDPLWSEEKQFQLKGEKQLHVICERICLHSFSLFLSGTSQGWVCR